jgi:hypothetical protein
MLNNSCARVGVSGVCAVADRIRHRIECNLRYDAEGRKKNVYDVEFDGYKQSTKNQRVRLQIWYITLNTVPPMHICVFDDDISRRS